MFPPIIDYIGYYGPVILFAITFYCVINRTPYLIAFVFGSIINIFINKIIKITIREPRPRNQIPFIDEELIGTEQYGFPSGHAQSSFFSLAFLAFANGPPLTIYFMTFLCAITLYQRYIYRRHTIKQLVSGSIIGIIFAYIVVYATQNVLYTPFYIINTDPLGRYL